MRAIPALGYPSRTAAAVALKAQRLSNTEIAERLGITAAQVSSLLISHERQAAIAATNRTVVVPLAVIVALERPARQRGVTVNALARRLLEVLAAEPTLIDNILDDAPDQTEAA